MLQSPETEPMNTAKLVVLPILQLRKLRFREFKAWDLGFEFVLPRGGMSQQSLATGALCSRGQTRLSGSCVYRVLPSDTPPQLSGPGPISPFVFEMGSYFNLGWVLVAQLRLLLSDCWHVW